MHTTTKHSPIEIMSNVKDQKFVDEVREILKNQGNIKKMRALSSQKEENTYQQLDKDRQQEIFIYSYLNPTIKSKSFVEHSWLIKGKVKEEKLDYCKIEIQENNSEHNSIQKGSVWKVHKHAIKSSKR